MSRQTEPTIGSTLADPVDEPVERPSRPTFDRVDDRFALGDEIGRGGMGRVFAATDVSLGREVAIKQMLSARSDDLARFEREVRITAQLEHPSIVPIYEAARDQAGRAYYVMRRIEGEPLAKRLVGRDLRERLALLPNVLAVVDAAAFAHARQIIHRDIKPSNILLGSYGETHLIDWGLARRLDESELGSQVSSEDGEQLTRAGHVYGTVAYMAPEQARGEPVDQRADVYALGATLFHVLAGTPPFAGLSDAERIAAAKVGEDTVPLNKLGADTPPELIAIVDKAMARCPDARYSHAGELAADLRAFLAGKLVGAHRYTPKQRLARFVRRHRVAVAISVFATIALATVGVVAFVNVVDERNQARTARAAAESAADDANRERGNFADSQMRTQLARANVLAEIDPARAVNLLRAVPHEHKRRARDIAAKAAAYGIPHGSTLHQVDIRLMAMAPDGVRLVTSDARGLIGIHELAKSESRELVRMGERVDFVGWVENGAALVAATPTAVFRIDPVTREKRELVRGSTQDHWIVRDTHVRCVDPKHRLIELSARDGTSTVLADDVVGAVGVDDLAVLNGEKTLRVLSGTKVTEIGPTFGKLNAASMALSPQLGRFAHSVRDQVIEWDVVTGRERRRWPLPMVGLQYGDGLLYGTINGRLNVLLDTRIEEVGRSRGTMGWATVGKHGAMYVFDDGTLMIVNRHAVFERMFGHTGTRVIASSPSSHFVAVGSTNGLVRWWDVRPIAPLPLPIKPTSICWADHELLIARVEDHMVVLDRKSNLVRRLIGGKVGLASVCLGRFGNRLAYRIPGPTGEVGYVDLATGKPTVLPDVGGIAVDSFRQTLVVLRDKRVFSELSSTTEKPRWTAPADADAFAIRDGWLAVVTVDRVLTRLAPDGTSATTQLSALAGALGVAQTGDVYFVIDRDVLWWGGHGDPQVVHKLSSPVGSAVTYDDRAALMLEDRSMWTVGRTGARNVFPNRNHKLQISDGELAAASSSKQLVTTRLGTDVQTTRWFGGLTRVNLTADSRSVIATLDGNLLLLFEDVVPADPGALEAWIDSATNARLQKGTEELSWKID